MFLVNVMETIIFAGIKGKVTAISPHGSYFIVELSNQVVIVGTYNNKFNWDEAVDNESGFDSFITYIGVRTIAEAEKVKEIVSGVGGYFYAKEQEPRRSKRVKAFPLELKIRGLTAEFVAEFVAADEI